MTDVIVRKQKRPLTDEEKYRILDQYSQGVPVVDIASSVSRDTKTIRVLIQEKLKEMNAIRETNDLIGNPCTSTLAKRRGSTPSKFITTAFLDEIDEKAFTYAYYYSATGDNKFSLDQSGLSIGIPKNMRKATKDYVYRIRGQYLRDIPTVGTYIKEEQQKRIENYELQKPQIQMELVNQIEEMKELVANDPRQRTNLLKSIEMLGRTIGAFTDRVEVEEVDAKSGLEILMSRAKAEVIEAGTYEVEDGKED